VTASKGPAVVVEFLELADETIAAATRHARCLRAET
jgi:hypothetical protein